MKKIQETLEYLNFLKKSLGLTLVDCHIHPFDVMGWAHQHDYVSNSHGEDLHYKKCLDYEEDELDHVSAGFLERLGHGRILNTFSEHFYKAAPGVVSNIIRNKYQRAGERRLLSELKKCHIDKAVLMPIAPWSTLEMIQTTHPSAEHFYVLGSVDIHALSAEEIRNQIKSLKDQGVLGIKMHPNLQGFLPQPGHNESYLAEKLDVLYSALEKEGLYIHFHGGRSFYTEHVDTRYSKYPRSKTFARLEHFIDSSGKSELFDNYNLRVVIAHMGNFAISSPNFKIASQIIEKSSSVLFDTTGISRLNLVRAFKSLPPDRIMFGSDALYNKISHSLFFVMSAITDAFPSNQHEAVARDIFGGTFARNISKVS